MAIQYVDANRQNTTFVPTNKQNLIDNIETVLLAAGWTTVSGHGTTNLLMQTATTPQGLNMRFRFKDNTGTCIQISLENVSGTKVGTNTVSTGAPLNPGASSKTYRIVANKYQAVIWTASPTPAREFAMLCVPFIPSFLSGVITELGFLIGNGQSDTGTSIMKTLRTGLDCVVHGTGLHGTTQALCNGNLWQWDNNPGVVGLGALATVQPSLATGDGIAYYRWHDASAALYDALIGWGLTTGSDEGQWRGQLWDAMVSSEAYNGDLTFSADSHNWIVLTDNNTGSNANQRGTLMIAVP
jgi:hypothetical protein